MRSGSAWKRSVAAAFFCSCGIVYNSPAIAAESTEPANASSRPAVGEPGFNPGAGVVTPQAKDVNLPQGQSVKVGSFGQVDLHVKDLDLASVLQLLSIHSQRNIVASRNVAGTVTADLYNVDFYEALDAILHTNGFGYREKGNFIYVYTKAELDAMAKAEMRAVSRVVRLNYITAAEALSFITPLISPAGSVAASGSTTGSFQPSLTDGGANSRADADVLVIRDYPDNVQQMLDVIKELDVRPKQVLVEATILRARLTEQNAFGVDISIMGDIALDQFTSPLGAVDDLLKGTLKGNAAVPTPVGGATTSVGNTISGPSGAKVGIVTHSIAAFIRALDQVTDTTVLANPKILVLNRQKADLHVGQKLGYLSTTSTDTSTTQTVEFLDVGTKLTLRPFVSDDGNIRMELKPSLSDGETVSVANFVIPNESTQELTTNVMVKNGQTIVLGGLFIEDNFISRKQVPLLGDVPILGWAFKGQDDDIIREEVIFLVTPTIMKEESLYAAGERAKDSASLALLGSREGLLPWSRSKLTASHLREAVQAYDAGDREKALWAANMALGMDPTLVEARRLKEELSGQREYGVNRSLLEDAVNRMIKGELEKEEPINVPPKDNAPGAIEVPSTEAPAPAPAQETAEAPAEVKAATEEAPAAPAEPVAVVEEVTTEAKVEEKTDSELVKAMEKWLEAQEAQEAQKAAEVKETQEAQASVDVNNVN